MNTTNASSNTGSQTQILIAIIIGVILLGIVIVAVVNIVVPMLESGTVVAIEDGSREVIVKNPSDPDRSNIKGVTTWTGTKNKCILKWEMFTSQFLPDERWGWNFTFEESADKSCSKKTLIELLNKVKEKAMKIAPLAELFKELIEAQIKNFK